MISRRSRTQGSKVREMNSLFLRVLLCLCLTVEVGKTLPREEWIDPGNMIDDVNRVLMTGELPQCPPVGIENVADMNKLNDCRRKSSSSSSSYEKSLFTLAVMTLMLILVRNYFSTWRFILLLSLINIIVSIAWEWKACTSKQVQLEKEISLVDTIWNVSLSNAIVAPFVPITKVTGKSFDAIFRGVPIQWQPVVFVAVMVVIILAIFMLSGLQVRLPFMTITTDPALPGNIHANLQWDDLDAIDRAPLQEHINNQQIRVMNTRQLEKRFRTIFGGGVPPEL